MPVERSLVEQICYVSLLIAALLSTCWGSSLAIRAGSLTYTPERTQTIRHLNYDYFLAILDTSFSSPLAVMIQYTVV